jgi:PAS domain S-box-containing protein
MDRDCDAGAQFTQSSALFDSVGALVTWDRGFEIEFAGVRDLIAPGTTYPALVDAVLRRKTQIRTLDGQLIDAELVERSRHGPFGTPRSFVYRNPNGQVIQVEETISVTGHVFRVAADVTAEWSARQELEETKKRLAMADQAPAAVPFSFTVRADGQMDLPAPTVALKRLYGLPDDFETPDGLGLYMQVEMTPEEQAAVTEEAKRCKAALEPLIFEYRVRDAEGSLRWIRNHLLPRKLPDGTVVFEGGQRDITSEKLAQDQLDLLRAVVVRSSDSVILVETTETGKSTILYVNPAFERLFGRTLAELAGKDADDYSGDPVDAAVNLRMRQRLAEGDASPFEFQTRHAEGHLVWVEARVCELQGQVNGTYRWAVISRDISERRRSADELARSEHMLAEAQRMAKMGTWELDLATREIRWTEGMYALIGLDRSAGPPSIELFLSTVHPDDHEMTIAWGERILAGDDSLTCGSYRVLHPDGAERYMEAHVELVKDHLGKVQHAIGTVQDVTLQHTSELELLNALKLAKAADRAKSEFLANMSHELRTPLNAIMGFSELLMLRSTKSALIEKQREYLQDIYNSGQHLLDIINDILSLSKIEAGQTVLDEEVFELPEVINWIFRLLVEKAKRAGVLLRAEIEPGLPGVFGDSRLIRQTLLNLASNAIKFSNSGGCVSVLASRNGTGDLTITVSDSGIGMTRDEIAVALTPFGQVESALQRRYEGTGLGLPLAKKFVELHGGQLSIESAPNRGTSVTACFPKRDAPMSPTLRPKASQGTSSPDHDGAGGS